jgi:hypothetical protein
VIACHVLYPHHELPALPLPTPTITMPPPNPPSCPPPHTHTPHPQEDGPDALEEVTNNNLLPGGKKLRSDDPNYKSSEQIRCGAREAPWRVAVFGVGGLVGGLEQGKQ